MTLHGYSLQSLRSLATRMRAAAYATFPLRAPPKQRDTTSIQNDLLMPKETIDTVTPVNPMMRTGFRPAESGELASGINLSDGEEGPAYAVA